MDNSITHNLWRILWKERAFRWLKEERHFKEVDLDSCLKSLQQNPVDKNAAFAIFWGTYLSSDGLPIILDRQIEEVKRLFEECQLGDAPVEDIPKLAFVKLHLAGILAICLIRPDYPTYENPSLITTLEKSREAHRLAESPEMDIDDPKAWGKELANKDLFGFSSTLINGIINMELASIYLSKMRYEDALACFSEGAWDICATTIEETSEYLEETKRMVFHTDGFFPYLPHLGHEFDIQEAADIFEEIKRHPKDIKRWEDIRLYCEVLKYLGHCELYDYLLDGIKDSTGEEFSAAEYWGKAITFSEERMQIINSLFHIPTREAQERAEIEERLKRDFLGDSWREFTEEASKILVDAEIAWIHNRPDNMIKEIRPLLEIVLPSVFLFLRFKTGERSDSRLPLTIMKDDIKGNPIVLASIRGMKIKEKDKQWVMNDLVTFLTEVIHLRNYFEKEIHREKLPDKEKKMRERAILVRRQLLGIGSEGVLIRLMKLKNDIKLNG